jgi:hypothetical protein
LVYGGNDGWVFIEDAAYTLLINTLLEQQQQEDQVVFIYLNSTHFIFEILLFNMICGNFF